MSQVIQNETWFFLSSVVTGVLLAVSYDVLRIFRRVFRHGIWLTGAEDFLYWCGAAFCIFCMVFQKNNGAIRGFALIGIGIGAVLYHESMSTYLVKWISAGIRWIVRGISRGFDILFAPCRYLKNVLKKNLAKILKSVKKAGRIGIHKTKRGKINKEGSYAKKKKKKQGQ